MNRATVTITIGRNWGRAANAEHRGQPMSASMWGHFNDSIVEVLEAPGAIIHVKGASHDGRWDGAEEEAATYVADIAIPRLGGLVNDLQGIAAIYLQDAIALTVGATTLVTPK